MAHFVFVNPSTRDSKGATSLALTMPPIGLAYLAAVIESRGHSARIIDANKEGISWEEIAGYVSRKPDIIGITANILTIKIAVLYAEALKRVYPQAQILFGGPQVSAMGQVLLERYSVVDALVIGEGETTIAELAERVGQRDMYVGVPGVIFRIGSQIVNNGPRPLIADIDLIPRPAYHLLPHLSSYRARSRAYPVGYVFTSRGCPAACTFCYRNFGSKWRARSPENVIEEITFLREEYGIRQLDIMDDNFSFDVDRAHRILEMIIAKRWNLKINLQFGVRIHSLNRDLLNIMKKAGVFKLGFGIESGDEAMLKRIKKGLDLDRAIQIVQMSRSLGMVTHGYFIIGFPRDSPETMQRTIDFAKRLDPHYASFAICTPMPGTEMYNDIARNGVFLEDVSEGIDDGLFALKVFFQYGDTKPEQVRQYCERAWKEFYSRPKKIIDVLTTIRSRGEFLWLTRVIADMARSKKNKKEKFFSRVNAWDIYFIIITLLYIIWKAKVFFERFH